MAAQNAGTIGILPAGALGVAFFHHLRQRARPGQIFFVDREGSASGMALRQAARLEIATAAGTEVITGPAIWRSDLLGCLREGDLPEIVLVCTQPDQLLGVITTWVRLLEELHAGPEPARAAEALPILVLCSNGIYFQRVRQFLVERLEESTLFGRLPDLWPDEMPQIVAKLIRGVTIQTGQREGSGGAAIYRPGALGRTLLAGGSPARRSRCAEVLASLGGWVELAESSPTRVEFDKALVNLTANLCGQLAAIDEHGHFQPRKVAEILDGPYAEVAQELARRVVEVGKAVHAYGAGEEFQAIWQRVIESCQQHLDHIPSSIQWVQQELRRGTLKQQLGPTETWLLEPLTQYAKAAGLEEAAEFFAEITQQVEQRLGKAIEASAPSAPARD